jgi:hypothetical protein
VLLNSIVLSVIVRSIIFFYKMLLINRVNFMKPLQLKFTDKTPFHQIFVIIIFYGFKYL